MRQLLFTLGLALAGPSIVTAETAVTVDFNAIWRVDLRTHGAEWIADLGTPDPRFSCRSIAVSAEGDIRCLHNGMLYEIQPGAASPLSTLPSVDTYQGLAFDGIGRLLFTSRAEPTLWQLDPSTGAVLDSQPFSLVGTSTYALAALGTRIFVITNSPGELPHLLEEIDPANGESLSAVEVGALGVTLPIDAAFDPMGDLWVANNNGEIILGLHVLSYLKLHLSPLSAIETWSGLVNVFEEPAFMNIDSVATDGIVEIPMLSHAGAVLLTLSLLAVAWYSMRRGT